MAPCIEQAAPRVLVSACLLGEPVRFDGQGKAQHHEALARWQALGCLVPLCPEVAGGLGIPRPAAEIEPGATAASVLAGSGRVLTRQGQDVSQAFRQGAEAAAGLVAAHSIRLAVMKARSPSCGTDDVYDGQFRGQRVAGQGVTVARLQALGVQVFHEDQWDAAWQAWEALRQAGSAGSGGGA